MSGSDLAFSALVTRAGRVDGADQHGAHDAEPGVGTGLGDTDQFPGGPSAHRGNEENTFGVGVLDDRPSRSHRREPEPPVGDLGDPGGGRLPGMVAVGGHHQQPAVRKPGHETAEVDVVGDLVGEDVDPGDVPGPVVAKQLGPQGLSGFRGSLVHDVDGGEDRTADGRGDLLLVPEPPVGAGGEEVPEQAEHEEQCRSAEGELRQRRRRR
jgi:hypothetical protein